MKSFILSLVVLVLIFFGSAASSICLTNIAQELSQEAEEISKKDFSDISLESLSSRWDNCKNIFRILSDHRAADIVDEEINSVAFHLKKGNEDEFYDHLNSLIYNIGKLKRSTG